MVGGKAAAEAGAVTHGAVRCSAWLGDVRWLNIGGRDWGSKRWACGTEEQNREYNRGDAKPCDDAPLLFKEHDVMLKRTNVLGG